MVAFGKQTFIHLFIQQETVVTSMYCLHTLIIFIFNWNPRWKFM